MTDRERWDARYAGREAEAQPPPPWLDALPDLPMHGRALDVAAGTGRVGLWAARRGLEVTLVDVSQVGLALAAAVATREALDVTTVCRDLAVDGLPGGRWNLITCFAYELPELWPAMCAALTPGGVLVAEIATTSNLERHARPSARFLVQPGELAQRVSSLELVHLDEGWHDNRHTCRIAARRSR